MCFIQMKKKNKMIYNSTLAFLNLPRGDGSFCPARGGLWLLTPLIDGSLEPISAGHNSNRGADAEKQSRIVFFPAAGM